MRLQYSERVNCDDESERKDNGKSERGARDDESNPAEENSREEQVAEEDYLPEMRRVSARNLQLPRGEFEQLPQAAIFVRRGQASGHEMNREPRPVEGARHREIVRGRATPGAHHLSALESRA